MSDLLRDHGLMVDDELDELYRSRPEQFTALRARLATTAKQRGDVATAKQISAARKPTTAAWIVNLLALINTDARQALTQLGERLRAAHAAMNGERIRELSAEQRALVDELSRAAFEAAEMADPSGALRDDVTGTLQAAIADPDVAARLGRLAKAERWSGFGEFGDTATVLTVARRGKAADESPPATHKQADKDRAPKDSRPHASSERPHAPRWPRPKEPSRRPPPRYPNDRPNSLRPGCVMIKPARISMRPNARSAPPKRHISRPSKPTASRRS